MKSKQFFLVFSISVLVFLFFLRLDFLLKDTAKLATSDVFVGVEAAYGDVEDIKKLIDEVRSYTNLFVIGSTEITFNITKLDEICQYVYDKGLYFIVYTHPTVRFAQPQWVNDARQRWSERFLGLYVYDEVGGRQIDRAPLRLVEQADNYTDAANKYVERLDENLKHLTEYYVHAGNLTLFSADYALYWFDYKGGYDVILAEFGWNHSRPLNVALSRGAATAQGRDWGVMITWTYYNPPYLESGEELYNDMILAYKSGANYIVVFNYPKISTYGILQQEHLDALKKFWKYIGHNSRTVDEIDDRVAYVLPKDYGYGFRGPNDKIWGLWEADELSSKIWNDVNNTWLSNCQLKMDIIYEDALNYNGTSRYFKLIFWNGTITNTG